MMGILYESDKMLVSFPFLLRLGVSAKNLDNWGYRKNENKYKRNGIFYFNYDAIPAPSRAKLPSKEELCRIAKEEEQGGRIAVLRERIEREVIERYPAKLKIIRTNYPTVRDEKRQEIARLFAAWEFIEWRGFRKGECDYIRFVFNEMFNNRYTTRESFSRFLCKIKRDGLENCIMDRRCTPLPKYHEPVFKPELWDRFLYYALDDRQFSTPAILDFLKRDGFEVPTPQLANTKRREWLQNNAAYAKIYGVHKAKGERPYQHLKPPSYVHSQWQIDGWTMPFYTDGGAKPRRWSMVRVVDVCSRRILSTIIAESENAVSILQALREAVETTGHVPSELVMDKHSATHTKDFEQFEIEITRIGTKIKVSTSPTDKAVIERYNGYLNSIAKEYPEWLWEGIAGKNPKRRSPETMRELVKAQNMLTPEETVSRGKLMAAKFNRMELRPLGGISPNDKYETTDRKGVEVSETDKALLFAPVKFHRVHRGMITIQRGVTRMTYTLSAENYSQWNNKDVMVHSYAFGESIYLFDIKRNFIECLEPDTAINTSVTERDAEEAPKNIGIAERITNEAQSTLDKLVNDPDSAAFIPNWYINKDAYSEMQYDADLRHVANMEGLRPQKKHTAVVHVVGEKKPVPYNSETEENEAAELGSLKDFINKKDGPTPNE